MTYPEFVTKFMELKISNFTPLEALHGNNFESIPPVLHENIFPTLAVLQKIREYVKKPITINSTYRNEVYNRKIGGKPFSLHVDFNAIDFSVQGYNGADYDHLYQAIHHGTFTVSDFKHKSNSVDITPAVMGAGLYSSFIHIDTRGLIGKRAPARWNG